MRKKRPIIGITKPESKRMNLSFLILAITVWLSGGKVKITSYDENIDDQHFDGLLLGGGTDVFPGLFFKDPIDNYPYDMKRDNLEVDLLKKAVREKLPVFAICRGAQLMNVVNGGTLHLDMTKVYEGANYPDTYLSYLFFRKKIIVYEDTLLFKISRKKEMMVNSIHKRSIDKVGKDLIITAREPNGVVQAIEKPGHPFFLGVQFHPERLFGKRVFRRLFRVFIETARRN